MDRFDHIILGAGLAGCDLAGGRTSHLQSRVPRPTASGVKGPIPAGPGMEKSLAKDHTILRGIPTTRIIAPAHQTMMRVARRIPAQE